MTSGPLGTARDGAQQGIALVMTILIIVLVSALMAGFVGVIVADQRAGGFGGDQTQTYAAAHAGLEKLTSDLAGLFATDFSPSSVQVAALSTTPPALAGFQYLAPDGTSGYTIAFTPDASGNPAPADVAGTVISAGPFQGFRGIITPYNITVTARAAGGAEVRMRRTLQTVAIPVFQFGMFSETDLAFHAGEQFDFGGRVHTNGTLYLAQADGSQLTLYDRVTAVQEVIRTQLPNGLLTSSGYNGRVRVPISTSPNNYRDLGRLEGSFVPGLGSGTGLNPLWWALSRNDYASYIINGLTGAKRLDLPLTSQGATPIDLIRRPAQNSSENTAKPLVFQQRFFAQASLRILLSDDAAEIKSLPSIATGEPVVLGTGATYTTTGTAALRAPLAMSFGPLADGDLSAGIYKSAAAEPLLDGVIKIEMQRQNGTWLDVTAEILGLGIAGRNIADISANVNTRWSRAGGTTASNGCLADPSPNAVIRLQRVRDVPVQYQPCGISPATGTPTAISQRGTDYWPNTLYDPREGQVRDGLGGKTLFLGGIMHYVELDVNNLRRWFLGQIGTNGTAAKIDNGYVVYFSDRRNNKNNALAETGEYGWEDIVNPASTAGTANGTLDGGEDLNGSNTLDVYGKTARNLPAGALSPFLSSALVTDSLPNSGNTDTIVARANRTVFFRRALKIVNGALGNLPSPGLTITSENPVYLQGNYNATAANAAANPHVAAAIIADAVTLLSNNWNDVRSFVDPSDAKKREATTTGYRVAIIAGKGLAFTKPSYADASFGSDGGAHNFMRNLEDWSDNDVVQRYRGSLVSFYINRQAVGTFKCCQSDVNIRGERDWAFDTDFLTPSLLPPATPMFRDVNTLTFRQLLRPNQ